MVGVEVGVEVVVVELRISKSALEKRTQASVS
jgi:hypothetical protein